MQGEPSLCGEVHRRIGEAFVALSRPVMASSHPSNETYSFNKEELGNTSSSPRASVIYIPELFTYAIYIVNLRA